MYVQEDKRIIYKGELQREYQVPTHPPLARSISHWKGDFSVG